MSKKIKEIDIKAFRAYKDVQKFNFLHKNSHDVANLVAIYAPNGYGKTSFFDAIEWAITGTIERLNTGKPIKEEVKNEEGYILKNKDSNEKYGTVTIISAEDAVLSVNTKEKKGNMKSDFKPGEIAKISPELQSILNEKESFCATNLLAHDKITSFLQNYTAQGKTSELRVMWDENNYSEILNEITELYNRLEVKKKQLSVDISKEEKELKKYKYENDQSDKVIKLLSSYEKKYNKCFMSNNSLEIDKIILLIDQYHEESQKEREEKQKECDAVEMLLKDYSTFESNRKQENLLQGKKEKYNNVINICNKIEQIKEKQEKITGEIEQVKYLIDNLEEFYSYIDKIKLNIAELKITENKKIECQKEKIIITEKIQSLDERLKNGNNVLEKLLVKEEQLRKDYYEHNSNKLKKERYKRLSDKARYILERRNNRIGEWNLYIEQINLFLEGRIGIVLLYNVLSEDIIRKYISVEKLDKERKLLTENNNILESNKKNLIDLFDKIQQLSIKGRDIVIEQKRRECPLCHMEYQDYNELLDRISVATEENVELARIDEQIQKNKERNWKIDEELKKLNEEVKNTIFSTRDTYEKKRLEEDKKIKRLQMKIEMWEKNINTAIYVCKVLEEKYQQKKLDISCYDQLKSSELEIEEEKEKKKKNIEKVWNSAKEEKIKEKELEQKIQFYELKKLEIEACNNAIRSNEMYIKIKECIGKTEFLDLKYNCTEMQSIIEDYRKQLLNKNDALNKEITNYNLKEMCSKEEYLSKLNECYKEINELQVETSSYLHRCEKLMHTVDKKKLLMQINEFNENLKSAIKIIDEKIQSEISIRIGLSGLREQQIWISKKESVESKKIGLEHLDIRIKKLQESKSYVENYIVGKTNEYFNSDIINQIYNKIDPHPTMKHIKFITEKDKEGLKTHVYTYDESECEKISPVVYLSSAQVNILSLCIFLSKVLSEKNSTFNTIFIDDPIQHLDGINLLSFIDVLRTITTDLGRQIVISTHNEQFYKLLKVKMDEEYYPSRFIELTCTGKIKD